MTAVDQDQCRALPFVEVTRANAIDIDEFCFAAWHRHLPLRRTLCRPDDYSAARRAVVCDLRFALDLAVQRT